MNNYILTNNNIISNFKKCGEEFISYLDVSKESLNTYRNGIYNFFEYLDKNNIKYPTREDLKGYREFLKESKSINTANCYLTAIRGLFGYLSDNGLYKNISLNVKSVKTSRIPKKQILTLEQSKEIYKSLIDSREKALFSLMISTGLRGIEVARANIEDIKVYNNDIVLFVQCKKHDDKDEYVKLSEQTIKDIKDYIGDRTSGTIFKSNSNRNINNNVTTKTLRLIIKDIFKRFNLDSDTFSLHSLRRSFATISYENGADIHSIQQVLHHRSQITTQRYINQSTRDNNKLEYNVANAIFN